MPSAWDAILNYVIRMTCSNGFMSSGCMAYSVIHSVLHDDVIKWRHFPRYWPFVRGIHRSLVNSPHKGQWRGALVFPLICDRINGWVNNVKASDLRRNRAQFDVIVMSTLAFSHWDELPHLYMIFHLVALLCFRKNRLKTKDWHDFCAGKLRACPHGIAFMKTTLACKAIIKQTKQFIKQQIPPYLCRKQTPHIFTCLNEHTALQNTLLLCVKIIQSIITAIKMIGQVQIHVSFFLQIQLKAMFLWTKTHSIYIPLFHI